MTDITDLAKEMLKPCPFCGGKPYICQNYGDWYVGCNCPVEPASQAYEKEKAIELWNNRPLETQARQEQKEQDAQIAEKLEYCPDDYHYCGKPSEIAKAIRES